MSTSLQAVDSSPEHVLKLLHNREINSIRDMKKLTEKLFVDAVTVYALIIAAMTFILATSTLIHVYRDLR